MRHDRQVTFIGNRISICSIRLIYKFFIIDLSQLPTRRSICSWSLLACCLSAMNMFIIGAREPAKMSVIHQGWSIKPWLPAQGLLDVPDVHYLIP